MGMWSRRHRVEGSKLWPPHLEERQRRQLLATEARELGPVEPEQQQAAEPIHTSAPSHEPTHSRMHFRTSQVVANGRVQAMHNGPPGTGRSALQFGRELTEHLRVEDH